MSKVCITIPAECKSCYKLCIEYCPTGINIQAGLVDGDVYFLFAVDHFGNVWRDEVTINPDGSFDINLANYPSGFFTSTSGAVNIFLSENEDGSNPIDITFESGTYNCILITTEPQVNFVNEDVTIFNPGVSSCGVIPGWTVVWGNIEGEITNQTDLIEYIATLLLDYVPKITTITINGVTYDLSEDRTWNITSGLTCEDLPDCQTIIDILNSITTIENDITNINIVLAGKFDIPTGLPTDYLDGTGTPTPFPSIPAQYNPSAGTGISITGAYPNQTITNTAPDQIVSLSNGTGISISGTYPNFTITNSAPDQVVSLSNGIGISISGTYPNFTITNSNPDQTVSLTAGSGISISGTYPNFTITSTVTGTVTSVTASTPLSSSGGATPNITIQQANGTQAGYLSSSDWTTFNSKQSAITLTTTGTSGASTFVSNTLNIPQYTDQYTGTVTSVGLSAGTGISLSGTNPITSSGTITVTNSAPDQTVTLTAGSGINVSGTYPSFTITNTGGSSGGGGASVSYYLNGGTNQGTFGGNTYYEMSKTAVIGANADFNINTNGYIAQFITDAGDPALLNIPSGNWNFEMYFSASSAGGTPSFYVELYKYNGTFTLIASSSSAPEVITNGTTIDLYTTALAVPTTTLLATDRLAVRVYVTHSGRTITLHTQDNHLCQIITTFSTGITALNGLTDQVQTFTTGTTGTDFNILSVSPTHTFNLPTASATNRGALSSTDWITFNAKLSDNAWVDYSATSTITGWSSFVTKELRYKIVGDIIFVRFFLNGTSNAASTGFTLPIVTTNFATENNCRAANNNTNYQGFFNIVNISSIANFFYWTSATAITSTWTASGSKLLSGEFFAEIGSTTLDVDAQNFISYAGITDATQRTAINTLVTDLKTYGIWNKCKAIYPVVGGNATAHSYNLKNPILFQLSFSAGWTHASTGMTPNGTSAFANTSLNASTNTTLNSNHLSIYVRTNQTTNAVPIGAYNFTNVQLFQLNISTGTGYYYYTGGLSTEVTSAIADSKGFFIGTTRASNDRKIFRNSTALASLTSAITTNNPSLNVFIGARNQDGSATANTTQQIAFSSIGDGLTDTETANFYTAVQAFQTTLGRQV